MSDGHQRRSEIGTLLLLALVPTILFGQILIGSTTLFLRDVATYHYPGKRVLREIVLGGDFPYWSPYISAGQPLAANPVHQVFYPPTWLILLPDFTTGFNLLALFHVYLATFGMHALLRSMRSGRPASAFAGLSFGIGGLFASLLNLFPLLYTAAWLPVICLFTRRFLIHGSRRDFLWAALSFSMQVIVGEPVTVLQTGIVLCAYAIHRASREAAPRATFKGLAAVGAISLAALLVAAVQILPAVDHLRDSGRGRGIDYAQVTEWSTPPLRLAEPFFPAILGRWMLEGTPIFPANLHGAHPEPLFFSIYCGLAVSVLALAGLLARTRGWQLVATLILLSAFLTLGSHTPVFRALYEAGALRFIRFPEKLVLMGLFPAIVFSACAMDRLLKGDPAVRRFSLAVTSVVALSALASAAAAWFPAYESLLRRLYDIDATENIYGMVALSQKEWLLAALRGALLFVLLRNATHARRSAWLALFFAFVLADLTPQVREIAPQAPRAFLEAEPPVVRRFPPNHADFRIFPIADWIRARNQAPDLGPLDEARRWGRRNELIAQSPVTYGLRTVIDGDIDVSDLQPERDFVASVWELMERDQRPPDWIDIVASMSNAWFVSAYRRPGDVEARRHGPAQEAVRFIERQHDPRYYFATEMRTIADRHEFVRLLRAQRFSRRVAFVQGAAFLPAAGTVLAVRESANQASMDVETSGQAFLVMSVTPHKYWRITIDDQEVPAVVTNIGYQGVVVPAGRHRVVMRYRNPLVAAGAGVSLAMLLALIFVARPAEPQPSTSMPTSSEPR